MEKIADLRDIVLSFDFKKGDYRSAEQQLARFAELYAKLNLNDAELLRSEFDAKTRLGWLRIASSLIEKSFADADSTKKEDLCRIFFAMYSFQNLDFGYDGVLDVIALAEKFKGNQEISKKAWAPFRENMSREIAIKNLENKLFS